MAMKITAAAITILTCFELRVIVTTSKDWRALDRVHPIVRHHRWHQIAKAAVGEPVRQ